MSTTNLSTSSVESANDLIISRTFDAPRELVFKAWSEAERFAQWWGPKSTKIDVYTFDFAPGGLLHYRMTTPDGTQMWGRFTYGEITPPERIIFVSSFSDAEGNITRAPFAADFPLEIQSTLILTEQDGKTLLEMRGTPINATEAEVNFFKGMHSSMQGGWKGTLDALAEYLAA